MMIRMMIRTTKGNHRLTNTARAAAWLVEMQPSHASVGGETIEWEAADPVEAIEEAITLALSGLRVEAGDTDEDREAGQIVHLIDDETAEVAWDSHVRTPADLSSLRAEVSR